ncbi:helicase [Streptomyces sp. CB01881]|nr:helicase [Streptomyces sp. CB01881]TYC68624.1 helicase [Streptomyces sp. CB01881]
MYKTGKGLSLGAWLNNTKARKTNLTADQLQHLQQLEALGVGW